MKEYCFVALAASFCSACGGAATSVSEAPQVVRAMSFSELVVEFESLSTALGNVNSLPWELAPQTGTSTYTGGVAVWETDTVDPFDYEREIQFLAIGEMTAEIDYANLMNSTVTGSKFFEMTDPSAFLGSPDGIAIDGTAGFDLGNGIGQATIAKSNGEIATYVFSSTGDTGFMGLNAEIILIHGSGTSSAVGRADLGAAGSFVGLRGGYPLPE